MTETIEPRAWRSFLESFALQHRGWLVAVSALDSDGTPERVIEGLPLLDVRLLEDGAIAVIAGSEGEGDLREHRVDEATSLLVDSVRAGAVAALRIVTPRGETALTFRSAVPPELVDGIA